MARRKRGTPEQQARRALISELLSAANLGEKVNQNAMPLILFVMRFHLDSIKFIASLDILKELWYNICRINYQEGLL